MKAPSLILECRSAIIFPLDKQVIIHDGEIEVKGWSYSGGGNWVERVEVSPDGYDGSREISIFDFFFYLTIIIDSGHVWYAVDPENMTEKVGSTRVPLPLALILLLG